MQKKQQICVVRTDRLGDMILTLPMCKALRENCAESEIILIARKYVEPLLENCSVIDEVFYFDEFKNGIIDIFKENKFDVVYFPSPRLNECFAAFRNKIPLRVGTAYRYYSFLFNHKVYDHRKTAEFHEAEYNTRLVSSVLEKDVKTELVRPIVNNVANEFVKNVLNQKGLSNNNFIIIHPGSGGSAYNWKAENFGKAGNIISNEISLRVVVTGTKDELSLCEIVNNYCPNSINLCGTFDLRQMIALISHAKMLLANSTGVLHIASALDVHVLGLYPNSPHISAKRWGPYSKKSRVVSPPISDDKNLRDNMDLISIDEVVQKALELLQSL